jgi:hypothetical protein
MAPFVGRRLTLFIGGTMPLNCADKSPAIGKKDQ